MRNILEKVQIKHVNSTHKINFKIKEMVMMKKFVYAISTIMVGAVLLTGCGNKATTPKVQDSTPQTIQADKSEADKKPSTDVNGKALTDVEKQGLANADKALELANVTTKEFVETFYNETPATIDQAFDKLNSLTVIEGGIFGADTEKNKKLVGSTPNKLVSYHVDSSEIGKTYTFKDKDYYSISEEITVKYTDDGAAKTQKVSLTLAYAINDSKDFKIVTLGMKTVPNN